MLNCGSDVGLAFGFKFFFAAYFLLSFVLEKGSEGQVIEPGRVFARCVIRPPAAKPLLHTGRTAPQMPSVPAAPPMPAPPLVEEASDAFDLTISFAAGGWFQMYHFGVCKALLDTKYLEGLAASGQRVRFCGSSAGSLAAASLASGCHMHEEMRDFALICADHYRASWWHVLCMREYLVASIHRFGDRMMESEEQQQRTLRGVGGGGLEIYTTTLPMLRRKCLTHFNNLDDIEEALIASCCLSPVVGLPFPLRATGEWVCDGGIRSFQPRSGEARTLTVSPFYFTSAHIRPSTAVPVWWGLFPPSREEHESLFAIGYNACVEHLVTEGKVPKEMSTLLMTRKKGRSSGGADTSGVVQIAVDFAVTALYVLVLRPLAIVAIYVEMLFVGLLLLCMLGIAKLRGSTAAGDATNRIYDTFRNMVSLRVFLRLLLSSRIPINESRLFKHSTAYRAFQPLVFDSGRGVHPASETAAGNAGTSSSGTHATPPRRKRFIVDAHWNMQQRWQDMKTRGGSLWHRGAAPPLVL